MPVLVIYKLDSDEDPVSTLEAGEHIFGRGSLLKCDDRRVSRKHGVITVTDDAARITSTHQNPCFYQSVHSSTITILPKDSPVDISDGDKFALLADQFWFRIKVEKTTNGVQMVHDAVGDDVSTRVYQNSLSEIDKIERHSPSPQISKLCSSSTSNRAENVQGDSDNSMDFLNITPKRELEEDDMEMPSSKKAKVDDELLKNKDEPLPVWNDKSKKEIMSESEDENNVEVKTTSPLPTQQVTPKKGRAVSKKKAEALTVAENAHDAELKSMLFSSDDEEVNKAPQNVSSVKTTEETKVNNEVKQDKNDKKDANDNDEQKTNEDTNAPGTSGTKRQWRDRCWYGVSCYRKSSQHSKEFTHPGDSDYESDPNDDRPICAYGDTCYRQNKNHRQAYKHTKPPQKAPNKRKKKKNDGTATKKRATKKQYYDESSEDDYDMEDPFMADSGSEFEADSGSSDDDDSDSNSSGTEEETKRLLKEAKRFTKGKKKDKDDD